ncbi:hypothetical protein PV326_007562 [Microctonus aethiopoides]|nr:hypothetical protein PV326_007562 [Microctonus aethiopoides]
MRDQARIASPLGIGGGAEEAERPGSKETRLDERRGGGSQTDLSETKEEGEKVTSSSLVNSWYPLRPIARPNPSCNHCNLMFCL